jgi:ADP-ribose diphosphatase
MKKPPKILGIQPVAESRLFQIESVHLAFSNGEEREYDRIQGWAHGSVMMVPMRDDNTILLAREYGVGVEHYVLGFPKGAVDENEDPLQAANRELQEEIGYAAKSLQKIMALSVSPAYIQSTMQVILAKDLYRSDLEGDEPEPIEVVPWSLDRIDDLLQHPEFIQPASIAAALWIEREWRAKRS